jgi:transposase
MDELGFRWAWTPRYSPQYNGIEEVWAMSKRFIKEERLNLIQNEYDFDLNELIKESFDRMSILSISKCINRSLNLLNLNL